MIELFRRCAVGEINQVFLYHTSPYRRNNMYALVSDNRYRFRNKRQLEIISFDLFIWLISFNTILKENLWFLNNFCFIHFCFWEQLFLPDTNKISCYKRHFCRLFERTISDSAHWLASQLSCSPINRSTCFLFSTIRSFNLDCIVVLTHLHERTWFSSS